MTGNKAYLVEYQDYNGGPVAFGGSKGQITSKGRAAAIQDSESMDSVLTCLFWEKEGNITTKGFTENKR
ncbi:hypothetical protein Tco_0992635 [Tanacetum coccineum]|uniref:Uncharacterized protein n=1 Tax=Tanacetum coccineum TaxID=301880 RepID=A0ABQ5F2N1_9ASTR